MLQVDRGYLYYLSPTQSCFYKVNFKTYETSEVPLNGYKIFQIAVAIGRVYAIGEDGTLEVTYHRGDTLGQNVNPVPKAKDESDDEDDALPMGKEFERKAIKIEDIPEDAVDHPDALNSSVMAGSEAEDEEEPQGLPENSKEKSLLTSVLGDKNKKGRSH